MEKKAFHLFFTSFLISISPQQKKLGTLQAYTHDTRGLLPYA